jgi:hypothetical protein
MATIEEAREAMKQFYKDLGTDDPYGQIPKCFMFLDRTIWTDNMLEEDREYLREAFAGMSFSKDKEIKK